MLPTAPHPYRQSTAIKIGLSEYQSRYPEYLQSFGLSLSERDIEDITSKLNPSQYPEPFQTSSSALEFFQNHTCKVNNPESSLHGRVIFIGPPERRGAYKTMCSGFFIVPGQKPIGGEIQDRIEKLAVVYTTPIRGDEIPNTREYDWLQYFEKNRIPGIVNIFHTERKPSSNSQFISFQKLITTDLHHLLEEQKLEPAAIHRLQKFIIRALFFFHREGIRHGDIKPENILIHVLHPESKKRLTPEVLNDPHTEFRVYFCDPSFCSSKARPFKGIAGTLSYFPPEKLDPITQLEKLSFQETESRSSSPLRRENTLAFTSIPKKEEDVDLRDDIWPLGITLIEMEKAAVRKTGDPSRIHFISNLLCRKNPEERPSIEEIIHHWPSD